MWVIIETILLISTLFLTIRDFHKGDLVGLTFHAIMFGFFLNFLLLTLSELGYSYVTGS